MAVSDWFRLCYFEPAATILEVVFFVFVLGVPLEEVNTDLRMFWTWFNCCDDLAELVVISFAVARTLGVFLLY